MAAEKLTIAEKIDATFTIMFPQSSAIYWGSNLLVTNPTQHASYLRRHLRSTAPPLPVATTVRLVFNQSLA